MGDISMRGKGKALKMKKGGSTTERRKKAREDKPSRGVMILTNPPKFKPIPRPPESTGPLTKRPGPIIKPLRPNPGKPMPRDPKKVPEFRPMPRPKNLPRDLRDLFSKPASPGFSKEEFKKVLEKYMMQEPRKMTPAMKKDGGEIKSLGDLFSKPASQGFSKEGLKKAFEKAKEMKPTGRINMDDLKKALGMMGKGAGKAFGMMGKGAGKAFGSSLSKKTESKIKGRLGGPKTSPRRRTLRKLI